EPSAFQCTVKATNASGSSLIWSEVRNTNPAINNAIEFTSNLNLRVSSDHRARVVTPVQGGAPFEVCLPGDTCKSGVGGPAMGQMNEPVSVAVDNSAGGNGDVYVVDRLNTRVQKFSATGTPLLEMGAGVNESTSANLCGVR